MPSLSLDVPRLLALLISIPHQQLSSGVDILEGTIIDLSMVLEHHHVLLFLTPGTVNNLIQLEWAGSELLMTLLTAPSWHICNQEIANSAEIMIIEWNLSKGSSETSNPSYPAALITYGSKKQLIQ